MTKGNEHTNRGHLHFPLQLWQLLLLDRVLLAQEFRGQHRHLIAKEKNKSRSIDGGNELQKWRYKEGQWKDKPPPLAGAGGSVFTLCLCV
jgi:hypothetical protein